MGFIKVDRSQRDLFGYRISDFARSDAKSQFIVEIISRLDLVKLFQLTFKENMTSDSNRTYTADAGYHSLDQLEYIDDNDIDALLADQKPHHRSSDSRSIPIETIQSENRKVERRDFVYHKNENYYECPAGDKLHPVSKDKKYTVYRAKACTGCPIASYCLSSKSKIKQINRDHREELAEKMSRKLQGDEAKSRMKNRAASVEPVFGNIKQNLGFRRFSLAGLIQVKGELV